MQINKGGIKCTKRKKNLVIRSAGAQADDGEERRGVKVGDRGVGGEGGGLGRMAGR